MTERAFETLRAERTGPALVVTLSRPQVLNAYNARMGADLTAALQGADADDAVRAVILTGEGRAFCAGADLSAGAGSFDTRAGAGSGNFGSRGDVAASGGASFIHAMFASNKPIIAAFNGPAVGVGVTLALPADIKIAVESARFGFVFTRRGLTPEAASSWFLPQLVGLSTALRWCLEGRMISASEALAAGLVSELTTPEDLLPRALAIAGEIAANTAPVAVAVTRQLLWRFATAASPFEVLPIDGPLVRDLGSTDDVKEGVSAFLEKRAPRFPGKVSADLPPGFPWWSGP